MPGNLVWCTCQICSLEKEGGSWRSKSARRQRDRRNIQGPNDLQDDIQNPVIINTSLPHEFYQQPPEFDLNYQEFEYSLEESTEFVSNLVEEPIEPIEPIEEFEYNSEETTEIYEESEYSSDSCDERSIEINANFTQNEGNILCIIYNFLIMCIYFI